MSERKLLTHPFGIVWRREKRVHRYAECRIYHVCDDSLQNGALRSFNAGVRVDFDEENIKILI
jgi:hypothetical protein